MNRLTAFLKKYFHVIVFILLQLFCLILIYNNLNYPRFVMARVTKHITYPFNKFWNGFTSHFALRSENENLISQNMELMREEERNFLMIEDSLYIHEEQFGEQKKIRIYDYTSSHVVYNSTNKTHNYLIIDKGSDEGISIDMAVFSAQGIVGVVSDVSKNFSTVMSMLHPDTRVSAKLMPSDQIGTVIWPGANMEIVNLLDIPQHIVVNTGDSVFTSGFSNVYPKNILIGTVVSVEENQKNSFLDIELKLATNFNHINSVYTVKNLYKNEIDSLKANFKHE
ncbi:rod shape-determining protein MreC [Bacteroidales bacterium OttesenSCG-928-B11]|nr:rod shape-determining protein MreC [Bacteroidales bacterium OttesenSCG-928-C03]MDL2312962.1 rod shape-determining protein MreC [Bacteroidales bacterium OttesenSCG-928-B11]